MSETKGKYDAGDKPTRADEVSNEQLLEDYKNSQKEYKAYLNIANGYAALSELPENTRDRQYSFKAQAYRDSAEQCYQFLQILEGLLDSRGLR